MGLSLDEMAAKLSGIEWKPDKKSFIAQCPLNAAHVIGVSKLIQACRGGCTNEKIQKFFANGGDAHNRLNAEKPNTNRPAAATNGGGPVLRNGNGHHPPAVADVHITSDIVSWKLRAYDLLSQIFDKVENPRLLASSSKDDLIEVAIEDLRGAVELGKLPMLELSRTETDEEYEKIALGAVAKFQTKYLDLPATNGNANGAVPSVIGEYDERLPVDAFDAYTAMVGDKREYSWEGLIRDGCTGIVSALIGSGKSTLAMNLARAWALGVPFLDRECRQSKTLVVVSPKEYEAWADTIGFWKLKGLVWLVESTKAHFPKSDDAVRWFDFAMQRNGCRTFVLDTLFDFFGMPPNTSGDSNRIAMNEQTPLLQLVRERNYAGLVTGHAPKSEAAALSPRDPEESFGGHTAWTAQHRMRMAIRRKSQGFNAFITGRGGYGDKGISKEMLLVFDEETRIDSLGGLFADCLGLAALPAVLEALQSQGWMSRVDVEKATGKGKSFVIAGLREGQKTNRDGGQVIKKTGENRSTKYAVMSEPDPLGKLL